MRNQKIDKNKRTWDAVAHKYFSRQSLPEWGVFAVGREDTSLIGEIDGKSFLEIACGSGHSIAYLVQNGASSVYGLDVSHTQITFAGQTNYDAIQEGKVGLFEQPMEKPISLPAPVDTVFSIYGLGWTTDIDQVLKNVNACLKTNGKFVWSWEHPIYPRVEYESGRYTFIESYHDERLKMEEGWGTSEGRYIATRKISTWYNSLRQHGFEVISLLEPEPVEVSDHEQNPEKYYSLPRASLVPATIIFDCRKTTEA